MKVSEIRVNTFTGNEPTHEYTRYSYCKPLPMNDYIKFDYVCGKGYLYPDITEIRIEMYTPAPINENTWIKIIAGNSITLQT